MKVLVLTSTFPATLKDATPAFVRDQVIALKTYCPHLEIAVLAPHHGNDTAEMTQHSHFTEYRFTYFFPRRFQRLAGQGILPSIESNRWRLALVPFLFLFQLSSVLRLVRKIRPDCLYAHWFTPQGVNAALASAITGVPYVLTSHANDVRIWRKIPVFGTLIVRWLLPKARRITAVSEATRDRMRDFFNAQQWEAISDKVSVIPMGVDTSALVPADSSSVPFLRQKYGYGDQFLILFLGRLAAKKGVEYLIDAVARIGAPDLRLIIAGDGPLRGALEQRSEEVKVHCATDFLGYVTGMKKLDYLRLADVVVIPSIETSFGDVEGLPVVLMEALAAGKLCVATDVSGAGSVMTPGTSGFIVPQRDPDALAATIEFIRNISEIDRTMIESNAAFTAQQFDWSNIARRHCEFLFGSEPGPPNLARLAQ